MIKRCFAFGCSFTNFHFWPTWADFIEKKFPDFITSKSKELLKEFPNNLVSKNNPARRNRIFEKYNLHNAMIDKIYGGYH
jgi:hypothetical protein